MERYTDTPAFHRDLDRWITREPDYGPDCPLCGGPADVDHPEGVCRDCDVPESDEGESADEELSRDLAADPEYLAHCDEDRWAAWEAQEAANDRAERDGEGVYETEAEYAERAGRRVAR